MLAVSVAAGLDAMTGCNNSGMKDVREAMNEPMRQEREFMDQAIRHRSPDVQRVDLIGNTVVYTHIFDGIIIPMTEMCAWKQKEFIHSRLRCVPSAITGMR